MKNYLLFTVLLVFAGRMAFAQSAAFTQNTQWLENKLNTLVIDDEDKKMEVNGKKTHPTFKFNGCQMAMNIAAHDPSFSMNMSISWLLKDVTKVSYKKEKDGKYTFALSVPPDRMKINLGKDSGNSISGNFNLKDDDKDKSDESENNFKLNTTDEKLVQEMVTRFKTCIADCKK